MSEELKACPFCGSKVVERRNLNKEGVFVAHPRGDCWLSTMIFDVVWWNTRPIEDALRSRVGRLEDIIQKIATGYILEDEDRIIVGEIAER